MKIDEDSAHFRKNLDCGRQKTAMRTEQDSLSESSLSMFLPGSAQEDRSTERGVGSAAIRVYLREMGQHPLLGKVEEIELSKQIERGRKAILKGIALTHQGSNALAQEIHHALTGEVAPDKIVFSCSQGDTETGKDVLERLRGVHGTLEKLRKWNARRSESVRSRRADEASVLLTDLRFDPGRLEEIGRSVLTMKKAPRETLLPKAKQSIRRGWRDLEEARTKMVQGNLRLVISVARRYRNHGLDMLDLIQEGNLGLLKAVDRFDYRKGCKFSTYAVWWIRQTIRRAITTNVRPVRLPANVVELLTKMRAVNDDLRQDLQREPDDNEIAESLDLRPDQITTLRKVTQSHISMEAPMGDDGESVIGHVIPDDRAASAWEEVEAQMLYDRLDDLLKTLPEREEVILRLRYGIGGDRIWTLDEVAERFGVTRERIRQLEVRALRKMRHPRRAASIKSFLN